MSLFESASLVVTPNGTKESKLYAIKPTDGSGDLVVTRETTATRVNSAGLIENVAVNVPRLDYSNGTCPSILVEPQRTNLLLNSETLATQSITVTAQSYTLSFYGSGTVSLSGTHIASVVGLGTARKTYTFTPTAGTLILTISGTCTKGQLEAGSYATSYIPTVASSVTRNADIISKTGISSLIGQTEGTIFFEGYFNDVQSSTVFLDLEGTFPKINFQIGSGILYFYSQGEWSMSTAISLNTKYKIAGAYKNNDIAFYVNGVLIATDTSATITAKSNFYVNSEAGSYVADLDINSVQLYKTRLTNSELQSLTTI